MHIAAYNSCAQTLPLYSYCIQLQMEICNCLSICRVFFLKEISLLSLHSILIISTHNKVSIIQLQCQDLSLTNGKVFQSTYYHIIITLYNLLFCFLKGNILSSISILFELFIIVVDRSIYFLFCIFYFVIAGCYICTLLTLFSHTSWQNLSCYEHSLYLPLLQELN